MATAEKTVPTLAGGNLMSLMGISEGRALKAFDDLIDGQGHAPAFQGVHQTGGRTGGVLEANRGTDEEVELPEGRRGFLGVYLGHRFSFTAWKTGLSDDDDDSTEESTGPAYSGAISPIFDPANARLLKDACSAYQFTKKVDKHKFDFTASQAGHVRANCELLIYYADADQAITVATPYYYDSVFGKEGMLAVLKALVDKEAGGILPMPYKIAPITNTKMIGSNEVGVHHLAIDPVSDTKASEVYQAFNAYAETLGTEAGLEEREKIQNWLECNDRPASAGTLESLTKAAALGN